MKKLFISFFLIFTLFSPVLAADLKFTPDGGGKFIYCNNNEFITRNHLADYGFNPTYIMSNPDMEKGKYTLYFSHINRTELKNLPPWDTLDAPEELSSEQEEYYQDIKYPGFAIEVDVCFKAKTDTTVTLTSLGYEVQQPRNYYYTNRLINYEDSWGCLNAVSDYFKMPIYTVNSELKYEPKSFQEKTFSVKAGECIWLSEYIENYEAVGWLKPVHLLCDFEITEGLCDINIAAVRSFDKLGDRSRVAENAAPGKYWRDGQYKGVANSLPSTSANLDFEIDDSIKSGEALPVTIYNQYVPDGVEVLEWMTHINPQNDKNVRRNAAESDILPIVYRDSEKLSLYDEKHQAEKNDLWYFDPYHSDTRLGGNPNFTLDPSKYNVKKSASLANYCVKTNYKIKITNNGEVPRFFNYNAKCTSNIIAYITNPDGTPQKNNLTAKGYRDISEWDTLAVKELPPNKTTEFTLTVFLPINYTGGIRNSFVITDEQAEIKHFEDLKQSNVKDPLFTGKNYVSYSGGYFNVSEDGENYIQIPAEENVKKIFEMDEDAFRILYFNNKYYVMYSAFAETPAFYSWMTYLVSKTYVLDENFSLIDTLFFRDGFPFMLSEAGGKTYIRSNVTWETEDFKTFKQAKFLDEGGFSLPYDNGSGIILLAKTGGDTYLSPDNGKNYYLISYPEGDKKPRYIDVLGDLYYYAEYNMLYTSKDGLNWSSFDAGEKITKLSRIGDKFIINDSIIYEAENMPHDRNLILNSEVLKFNGETIENPQDLLVPADEVFKKAQIEYILSADKKILTVRSGERTFEFHAGSNIIIEHKKFRNEKSYLKNTCLLKDEAFLIPVCDVFSALGFDCEYFENSRCYVINANM